MALSSTDDAQSPLTTGASPPNVCELTILVPCLDEARTVGECVVKARTFLETRDISGEVVVADNGSGDGSQEIAERAGARVVAVAERGYGRALLGGIREARGQFVIMGDADGSYDFSALDLFVEKLRAGHDLVMGDRFRGGIERGAMPWSHRYIGNPVLSFLGRLFFGSPVRDFHCGMRGFRRDAILGLGLASGGMEFASEMVVKATIRDLRIAEVPTTLSPDGRDGPPHLRRWRDGWRHLRFLLLLSPRWLFLYPGIALLIAGTSLMAWLIPGTRHLGDIGLDVNTLAYSGAAVITGFQLMALAVFATVFAADAGLLPPAPWIKRLKSAFSLEVGIIIGGLLVLTGLVTSSYAVGMWGQENFGPLDTQFSLRIVIPAATAVVLGVQVAASGFFLSVLGLERN